ncbi:DedA family protein [Nocardioides sp. GXQ0305]|uniref:DedA family protein n=1 Tax=Nocardioides sp. GXQ0305 TaxID=3423912 RepID=UPI003D7DD963
MSDLPAVPLFLFLTAVGFLRAGATYALARGVRGLVDRRSELASRPSTRRGEDLIRRYGAPAVVLSFLTVGVQTAVHLAAGSLRMPLRRYLPALLVGALLWATIYTTVGFAFLEAVGGGRVWLPLAVVLGVVAVVLGVRHLMRPATGQPED